MMFFRGATGWGRGINGTFGMMGGYMNSGWGLLIMGIVLLVVVLIVVAVVAAIRKSHRTSLVQGSESLAVLNERFVKGEITEEEYTRMKRVLSLR